MLYKKKMHTAAVWSLPLTHIHSFQSTSWISATRIFTQPTFRKVYHPKMGWWRNHIAAVICPACVVVSCVPRTHTHTHPPYYMVVLLCDRRVGWYAIYKYTAINAWCTHGEWTLGSASPFCVRYCAADEGSNKRRASLLERGMEMQGWNMQW